MTGTEPDAVAFDLWAPDRGLFAAVRIDRRSSGGPVAAALVALDGEVKVAGHVTAEIGDSQLRVDAGETRIESVLRPASAPVDLSAPATATLARTAGLRRHVQLFEVEGTLSVAGKPTPLRATGMRAQAWGETATARRRYVTVATAERRLVTVMAVRPDTATPHGEELVAGYVVDPESDAAASFEEVRLSTIYGADGLPRKAGVELYRPGDELPARMSGETMLGGPLDVDGTAVAISLFRWTLTGQPGWGTYELEPAS